MSRGHEWARAAIDRALIDLRTGKPEASRLEALSTIAAKATELRSVARSRVAFADTEDARGFWTDVGEYCTHARERADDAVRLLAVPPKPSQLELPGVA